MMKSLVFWALISVFTSANGQACPGLTIENGFIHPASSSDGTLDGATVNITCNSNTFPSYTLFGSSSLTCNNGSWNAEIPVCLKERRQSNKMLPSWMKSLLLAALIGTGYMVYVLFGKDKKRKRQAGIQAAGPNNTGVQPRREPNCPDYTYDGIILCTNEDLQSSKGRQGLIDLVKHLKGNSTVLNLSLAAYQELGQLAGRTAFDCMDYVLTHCRYIFVYASENLTEDTMTRFQSQMCLNDVIQDNSWRVIPIFADRGSKSSCPRELQLLHGLEMWNFSSPDENLQNLAISKFDQTIIDGRKRLN